jgi:hypothetical protein
MASLGALLTLTFATGLVEAGESNAAGRRWSMPW